MSYQRIRPFPSPDSFSFPELRALTEVWRETKSELEDDGAYRELITKLQREWAIETGIIERLYTWDRGVTEVLIEQGIEASLIAHRGGLPQEDAEHIQAIIKDHLDIIEGLFGYIRGEEPLSEYFIRGMHAQFMAHQDSTEAATESGDILRITLLKGAYKTLPNNPRRPDGALHAYCPPEIVKEEMENLIRMYREAEGLQAPEVRSAWLHHRFTQIHPFQDGNGRVARALASLIFLREGLFPLVVRESDRQEYIGALESADAGDLRDLVSLFARRQRDSILKALGLARQGQPSQDAGQIIHSALEILKSRLGRGGQRIAIVYEHAGKLFSAAEDRLGALATTLDVELREVAPRGMRYRAQMSSADGGSPERHYFQKQIAEAARQLGYLANFDPYRTWARLTISTDRDFDFIVSFHGYGPVDNGLLAASAFTYIRAPREEGGTEPIHLRLATTDLFQLNYIEPYESTGQRFAHWLESAVAAALAEWKRSLT